MSKISRAEQKANAFDKIITELAKNCRLSGTRMTRPEDKEQGEEFSFELHSVGLNYVKVVITPGLQEPDRTIRARMTLSNKLHTYFVTAA